jgi:hypothetical protein
VLATRAHLRANVVVFIDGRRSTDRRLLADALAPREPRLRAAGPVAADPGNTPCTPLQEKRTMTQRAWVATRKGLIELTRGRGGAWDIARTRFLGEPVSMLLPPE